MMKRMALVTLALCILAVAFASTNCASTNGQLVVAETIIHTNLAKLDDHEKAFCTANMQFKQQCDDLNPLMISLLKAGDTFNQSVAHQQPVDLLNLVKAGADVYKALQALPSSASAQMFIDLANAIAQAGKLTAPAK